MSKQRYISTSYWDDEWVQALDPSEKLMYLYLMTNPLTNIAGVYKITIRRICFDTGFNEDTVKNILQEFQNARKVFREKEYIIIPNWPKHQKFNQRSKIKTGIELILNDLPTEIIKALYEANYQYPLDTLSIPYTYPRNYSDSDFDSDSDSDTPLPPKSTYDKKLPPDPVKPVELGALASLLSKEYKQMIIPNVLVTDHLSRCLKKYGCSATKFILDGLSAMDAGQYNNPRFVYKYIKYREKTLSKIASGMLDRYGSATEKHKSERKPYNIPAKYTKAFNKSDIDGHVSRWWYCPDPDNAGMVECIREDNLYTRKYPAKNVKKWLN